MNVEQLIKVLSEYPANAQVCVVIPDTLCGISDLHAVEGVNYCKELNIVSVDHIAGVGERENHNKNH